MELLDMKIFDLLFESDLDFFRFLNMKLDEGQDTPARVSSPHHLSPIIWQGK